MMRIIDTARHSALGGFVAVPVVLAAAILRVTLIGFILIVAGLACGSSEPSDGSTSATVETGVQATVQAVADIEGDAKPTSTPEATSTATATATATPTVTPTAMPTPLPVADDPWTVQLDAGGDDAALYIAVDD